MTLMLLFSRRGDYFLLYFMCLFGSVLPFFVAPVVGRYLEYIPVGADDTSGRTGIMMK